MSDYKTQGNISSSQLESQTEETISSPKKSTPVVDPQDQDDVDEDLPF